MTVNALAAPMTEQEQRIAIAEACGWECVDRSDEFGCMWWQSPQGGAPFTNVPDYLHDLNATHSAKLALLTTPELQDSYACHLGAITGGKCIDYVANRVDVTTKILFATAAQETEAILRTIGKWKEAV